MRLRACVRMPQSTGTMTRVADQLKPKDGRELATCNINYFSMPSIFSRLSTTPSRRITTRRGKKIRLPRPSPSRSKASSCSVSLTLNRSRCSRRRRARLRARTVRWCRNSCSSASGSVRVIRARRSERRARGRSEK